MNELEFETYTDAYLEQVRHTYNHYVENTTISFDLKPLTQDEMRGAIMPLNESYRSYIIKKDHLYAGYILITQHRKKAAYNATGEVTLYLDAAHTAKGIGPQALDFIEVVAKALSFHSLIATICAENESSIRLFAKQGYEQIAYFKEVGFKFGRWLDVVSYQKRFPIE
ncbi:GNAT family N-acetyltransferase [Paenibacillus nasutitermitis]|uniref:N-acetyltransferase n=1 Tax=Paenibacillus nasutitermitis TaxID=1652958 RepID=A0A917DQ49_9BACL|nr:GNAT family N-acetyltransferase [Paenibacillus nasutitermitis]GGD55757.1 N-acetyltransferase [Paenibacillus nasutitermitis]